MAKHGLRAFLRRGMVASQGFLASGASAVAIGSASGPTSSPYQVVVRTSGSAGNEVVNLPLTGDYIGQRLLVTFGAEGNAADVVRLNAAATGALASQALVGGTPTAPTNVDLDTVAEYALFEYVGGATPTWNVVYTTGALS